MSFHVRPTALANAFINAAAKHINEGKVDHNKGAGHWIARRIAIDAEQERHIGLVKEFDRYPERKFSAPRHDAKIVDGEEGHFD